jgi:tetratricopeptide (TPR) repeat protein
VAAIVLLLTQRGHSYPLAAPGETLIVISPFVNYAGGQQGYNVAGRLQAALEREIGAAQLYGVRVAVWPEELRDRVGVQAALQRSAAVLVIWGEYDNGRVLSRFTVVGVQSRERQWEGGLSSPADLPATINSALPEEVRYVSLLTLGQLSIDQGRWEQARNILTQALARPPASADARAMLYFWLGYAHQEGNATLETAIDYYAKALDLQPDLAAAYNNRGVAYFVRAGQGDLARYGISAARWSWRLIWRQPCTTGAWLICARGNPSIGRPI